jgi:ADP-ribose pyrophosphatase YjhB (NUDIX family)
VRFCPSCGSAVEQSIPEGDSRPRDICTSPSCGKIHYQNPRIVTGCIVESGEQILLCRRAIEPRYGLWTLPAGYLENAETLAEGAARETMEEANAEVEVIDLFSVFTLAHINQVYMLFRAALKSTHFAPGDESLEVRLLQESQIPWEELAFSAVEETIRLYFADRAKGRFRTHIGEMRPVGEPGSRRYETLMLS